MQQRQFFQFVLGLLIVGMSSMAVAQDSELYQADVVPADGAGHAESENYSLFGVVGNSDTLGDYSAVEAGVSPIANPEVTPTLSSSPVTSATPTPVTPASDDAAPILMSALREVFSHPYTVTAHAVAAIVATAGALGVVALHLLLNAPAFSPLAQLFGSLISTGNTFRRRAAWGVVRDRSTNQPLPLVLVRVFDAERKKLLESQTTDAAGRYSFLLPKGAYFLRVHLTGYVLSTIAHEDTYYGQEFKVAEKRVFAQDVYLEPQTDVLARKGLFWTRLMDVLLKVQLPLLIIGTVLTIGVTLINPVTMNYLVLALYAVIWGFEVYRRLTMARNFGQILNAKNKSGVGLAIIRLFDDSTRKLAATRVSDQAGSYNIMANRGVYTTQITHAGFAEYRGQVAVKHDGNLNKNYLLEPVATAS